MPEDKPESRPENRDESFIGRWSRRKREADVADGRKQQQAPASQAAAVDDTPEIDPATLPKIEEMTADSDFSVFLKKGVPELLKRQALRHAWSIDPAIRDFVEVAENQYNFNLPDGVPGFGELPAGTDIQALLAQAIGERPKIEAVADGERDAAAHNGIATSCSDEVPAIDTPPPPQAPQPAAHADTKENPDADAADTASLPATPQHDEPQPASARRRHGGALPDSDRSA